MFDKLNALAQRMDELEARLAEPGLYDDPSRAAKLLKERNELEPIIQTFRAFWQAGAGGRAGYAVRSGYEGTGAGGAAAGQG